jgi:hypothetical protein
LEALSSKPNPSKRDRKREREERERERERERNLEESNETILSSPRFNFNFCPLT